MFVPYTKLPALGYLYLLSLCCAMYDTSLFRFSHNHAISFFNTDLHILTYSNTKEAIQTLTIAMAPRNMARKEYLAILSDGTTAVKMDRTRQAMKKPLA